MGLHNDLRQDSVAQMPLRDAVTVRRGTPVRLAIAEMKQRKLGAVIVTDDDQMPLGMFTERLLARMLATDPGGLEHPVDDHMIGLDGLIVRLDQPVADLIQAMQNTEIRFICIVDGAGRVRKLGGLRAVMEYVVERFPRAVMVQEFGAKLHMDEREGA